MKVREKSRSKQTAGLKKPRKQVTYLVSKKPSVETSQQMENALRESHEQLLAIMDGVDADIYVADMQTYEILFMNRHMCDSFGGNLIGQVCWRVFRGESQPCAHCTNTQLVDAEGKPTGVYVWECENPITHRWYTNYDRAIRWIDGRLVRMQIAPDITARKMAEEALRDSERHYRSLFEGSPISIWEEDFSRVKQRLEELRSQGITDFRVFFESHPEVVAECIRLVEVSDVNQAALKLTGAGSKEELLSNLDQVLDETFSGFVTELVNIAEGKTEFEWRGVNRTLAGDRVFVSIHWAAAPGHEDDLSKVIVSIIDITERKQAEEQIRRQNFELAMLNRIGQAFSRLASPSEIAELLYVNIGQMLDNRNLYIALCDENSRTISFPVYTLNGERRSPASRPFSNGLTEYVIRTKKPLLIAHDMQAFLAEHGIAQIGAPSKCLLAVPIRIGERMMGVIAVQDYEREDIYSESHMELLETLAMQAAIALENSRLYGTIQQELAERTQAEEALRESEARYRHLFENNLAGVYRSTLDGRLLACNEALVRIYGFGSREEILRRPVPELHASAESRQRFLHLLQEKGSLTGFESEGRRQDGSPVWLLENATLVSDASGRLTEIEGTVVDITERKQAEETLARQTEELNRLYRASGTLISGSPLDLESVSRSIVQVVLTEFGQANCSVFLVERETNQLKRIAVAGPYADQVSKTILTLDGPGLVPQSIRTAQVINTPDVRIVPSYVPAWEAAQAELTIPLKIGDQVIGAIDVQSAERGAFKGDDERLMSIFAERAALALEHARLYAQTERRVQNLAALRTIDMAISSSFDLALTLNILLDQVIKQLGVHAADILTLDPSTQTLRFSTGQGFRTQALQHTNLRLGEGFAGLAVRERRIVTVRDLVRNTGGLQRSADFSREGFVVYFGVPLIARGQVKGVLEIFHRDPLELDQEKRTFLEMLAGQAAIAIDSVQLFDDLQSSNAELLMAYDETIEGWSRAMDLRDQDTEGHTQRVTQMTLTMAGKMGFKAEEFSHIRRGALLHDIGKMGIPDRILRKPGKLDDEEWKIMRTHPQLAYEMLLPITYLHSALDIPYCHHEKWDGTGYPRGLKGAEIPLPARIFALADVYDALISDRPYRGAWSKEKALDYIREQTGNHFDPNLSQIFIGEVLVAQRG